MGARVCVLAWRGPHQGCHDHHQYYWYFFGFIKCMRWATPAALSEDRFGALGRGGCAANRVPPRPCTHILAWIVQASSPDFELRFMLALSPSMIVLGICFSSRSRVAQPAPSSYSQFQPATRADPIRAGDD